VKEKMTDKNKNCFSIETVYNMSELKSCPIETTLELLEKDEQSS
jgi:hypothetical protein